MVLKLSSKKEDWSPLARLVLFMVCLSIAGSIPAVVYNFSTDIPMKNGLNPPRNDNSEFCVNYEQWLGSCINECRDKYPDHNWNFFSAFAMELCWEWCASQDNKWRKYC
jgi:hypothetical protein